MSPGSKYAAQHSQHGIRPAAQQEGNGMTKDVERKEKGYKQLLLPIGVGIHIEHAIVHDVEGIKWKFGVVH